MRDDYARLLSMVASPEGRAELDAWRADARTRCLLGAAESLFATPMLPPGVTIASSAMEAHRVAGAGQVLDFLRAGAEGPALAAAPEIGPPSYTDRADGSDSPLVV